MEVHAGWHYGSTSWRCLLYFQSGCVLPIVSKVFAARGVCKRVFVANWKAALRLLHIKAASLCRGHGSHASFQPALITPRSDEGQCICWNSGCHNGTGVHNICPDGRSVVSSSMMSRALFYFDRAQAAGWLTRAWSPSVAHQRDWRRSGYPFEVPATRDWRLWEHGRESSVTKQRLQARLRPAHACPENAGTDSS